MFRLLATTKCKRQQIAVLIISFFAYVSAIRNEGNNMLLQQQKQLQQQQTTIENSNYQSLTTDTKQQTTSNFRPSPVIGFTPADAAVPQQFKPTYIEPQHSTNTNIAIFNNMNSNTNNNILQQQQTQNVNRRYTIETVAAYGNTGEKQFSFPNEQQQIPQHLTDKPIYIYRDPFTNENYHYTPTETNVKDTATIPTTHHHNNYNNNGYKQHDDNQEYLVQSSMIVGTHQQQQHNPFSPYMSLSADKDVYLKRPGFVYDEKPSYSHPNSVIDKKSEDVQTVKANKISYDSHDYPPPSYFQQQTSNFLPTPVPAQPSTSRPVIRPTTSPTTSSRPKYRPPLPTQSTIFTQHRPQQQYLQSSQTTLPNYANNFDNYLFNKQQTSDYYRTEMPPPSYLQQQQQPQIQLQYENRPPTSYEYDTRPPYEYDSRPQSSPSLYQQRPPPLNTAQSSYYQHDTPYTTPPPFRPSYNNYYDYQIGEVPPQQQTSSTLAHQFNNPYMTPSRPQYPYQGPYRPPPPAQQQQPSGLATLAQYAPQFTSLLLSGVGGGGSNNNGPLGSLIGALTGASTTPQTSSSSSLTSSSSYNRRPINSQLIRALENIARNDDLQCVPKVLCQMIAAQTQRGQLPSFITSPAITNFLSGFPAASPALIYGRAALLGLSGGEKSCYQTYLKCPKNEYEIIYYLNNHRGGFFKFFSEPEEQQQTVNHDTTQQGATSLFSILAALTGTPEVTTTTPRPPPKPSTDITSGIGNFFTQLLSDYMGGATVEYQRRFKRRTKRTINDKIYFEGESDENIKFEEDREETHRDVIKFEDENRESHRDELKFKDEDYEVNEDSHNYQDNEGDFHDEEDNEDTQQGVGFKDNGEQDYLDDTQGRIVHKTLQRGKRIIFFPEMKEETSDEIDKDKELKKIIKKFNDFNKERKLKFPTATDERQYDNASALGVRQGKKLNEDLNNNEQNYGAQFTNYVENSYDDFEKESKKIKFIDSDEGEDNEKQAQSLYSSYLHKSKDQKTKLVFPKREGKILNLPYYAASYLHDYLQQKHYLEQDDITAQDDKFVIPNRERPLNLSEFPPSSLANIYNTHINSISSQNSYTSNADVNNNYVASSHTNSNSNSNHFLPTPPPPDNDYISSNAIYSNKDTNSNPYNYNRLKQSSSNYKPTSYPTAYSPYSPSTPFNSGSSNLYKPQRYTNSNSQPNLNRYHSSLYTTRRPLTSLRTTRKSDDKNIYVTNSRGVTEYYITPDGRKVYL